MKMTTILNTEEAKLNFLIGLIHILKADGFVHDEEKEYFILAAKALNPNEKSIVKIDSVWENGDCIDISFENKKEILYFLEQAIKVSYMDGEYSNSEKRMVRMFASDLGIKEETIEKIEKWVIRVIELEKEGDALLEL